MIDPNKDGPPLSGGAEQQAVAADEGYPLQHL